MINVYVIGCGGIGGYLVNHLPMVISSLSLDLLEKAGENISNRLQRAGTESLPCVVDRLVLIDGDTFNPRNSIRQGEGSGSKLVRRMRNLRNAIDKMLTEAETAAKAIEISKQLDSLPPGHALLRQLEELEGTWNGFDRADYDRLNREMVRVSFLRRMQLVGFNNYVNPDNLADIIPKQAPLNVENSNEAESLQLKCLSSQMQGREKASVVFLCVDNIQTRYDVFKYMEGFDDCLVVNGGNSKTTGHVTLYERSAGKELDPPVYEVYPDIKPGVDKRPDEAGCTFVAPQHDQIAITNSIVADVMMSRFVKWAKGGLFESAGKPTRYNDILIDTEKPSILPVFHPKSNQ